MSDEVAFQADVAAIPSNALAAANYFQGLLKAASADDVAPLAVQQLQDLGTLFHCNGPWAEKLPNLLQRTSSFRLQRLSALVGWMKGDVPSYMSLSAGGRASSLLCLVLSNVVPSDQVGRLLYRLSENCLPPSKSNASMSQLSQAASCVSAKLQCLGFGNHVANVVTRIRLFFMQSDMALPDGIMSDIDPAELVEVLENISRALRDDTLAFHLRGTLGIGWVISMALALCPDDVLVDIEGSIIQRGSRDNIHITIPTEHSFLKHRLESRVSLKAQPTSWVPIQRSGILTHHPTIMTTSFSWNGCHRSYFTIQLLHSVKPGHSLDDLFQSLSNLALFLVRSRPDTVRPFKSSGAAICDFLGVDWEMITVNYLSATLAPPSLPPTKGFTGLVDSMYQTAKRTFIPGTFIGSSQILTSGIFRILCLLFVAPSSPTAPLFPFWNHLASGPTTPFFSVRTIPKGAERSTSHNEALWPFEGETFDLLLSKDAGGSSNIHAYLIDNGRLFGLEQHHRLVCFSRGGSTVYPRVLEDPKVTNPRRVFFYLVDGMLQLNDRHYSGIITETFQVNYEGGDWMPNTRRQLIEVHPADMTTHIDMVMRLYPEVCHGDDILVLRAELRTSTTLGRVDFWNAYEGYWHLSYAAPCSHDHDTELHWNPSTSGNGYTYLTIIDRISGGTLSPLAPGSSDEGVISLTSKSSLAQFLQCVLGASNAGILYQGDCCLPCAMEQATSSPWRFRGIICGDPSSVPVLPTSANDKIPPAGAPVRVDEGVEIQDLEKA